MKTVAIYCVNYQTYPELRSFLQSVNQASNEAFAVIRVDVFCADNTETEYQEITFSSEHIRLKVFPFHQNKGYFGAVHDMMTQTSPNQYDFVIISNVDVTLMNDTLVQLASLDVDAQTGWIAPQIYSLQEQRDLNPQVMHRYSKLRLKTLKLMYKYPFLHRLYVRLFYKMRHSSTHQAGEVYAGHGSFIILTREYFKRCGIIDYPVFLYGEELYLAELCRRHSLKVQYTPQVKLEDKEHCSTGGMRKHLYYQCNYEAIYYILSTFYV